MGKPLETVLLRIVDVAHPAEAWVLMKGGCYEGDTSRQRFLLTLIMASIKISAFVDINELITSGRGNWPDDATATG